MARNMLEENKTKLRSLIRPDGDMNVTPKNLPATSTVTPQNLPSTRAVTPTNLQSAPSRDIMAEIQQGISNNQDVSNLVRERAQKINSDPNSAQYADSQRELEAKYLQPDNRSNQLREAITGGQQQATTMAPKTTNLSDFITSRNQSQTNQLVQALKQRIAESVAAKQQQIAQAPQAYDPFRAQSEVAKNQQLRTALERNANLGDRGGIGRQNALLTQAEGENRLNDINLQQQNFIDNANAEITALQNEGRFQEAQIKAEQSQNLLDALMNEQIRQEGIQRQDSMIADERQIAQTEQERNDFGTQIAANYLDLQAFTDRLQAQGAPQWQIDQVQAARTQKILDNNLNPQTGLPNPVDNTPEITSSSAALQLWEQLGVANEAVSRALGVPVNTPFVSQSIPSGGGSRTGGGGSNTTTSPDGTPIPNLSTTAIRASIDNFIDSLEEEREASTENVLNDLRRRAEAIAPGGDTKLLNEQELDQYNRIQNSIDSYNRGTRFGSDSKRQAAMLWMIQNQDLLQDDDVFAEIRARYGNITEQELKDRFDQLQQLSPSAGF